MPTPPATKMSLFILLGAIPGGGHTNDPPTLIINFSSRILSFFCHLSVFEVSIQGMKRI